MKKNELIQALQEQSFTEDVMEVLVAKLESYPDELSDSDMVNFDDFLATLEGEEQQLITSLEDAVEVIEEYQDSIDANQDELVQGIGKDMYKIAKDANDVAELMEESV